MSILESPIESINAGPLVWELENYSHYMWTTTFHNYIIPLVGAPYVNSYKGSPYMKK